MERQDIAQTRALGALGWMAAQEGLLEAFLHMRGGSVDDLRENAQRPATLAAVLDFILQEDRWVIDCAAALGCRPQLLVEDRAVLGGGDRRHWT
jgi:hypothetical protein